MKKFLTCIWCFLLVALTLGGCNFDNKNYPGISNSVENYEKQVVVLNVGESYEFDIYDIYRNVTERSFDDSKGAVIKITKYELSGGDNIAVKKNKITAKAVGKTYVNCVLYSKASACRYITRLAVVYIVDADNMTEVKTVEDLKNISSGLDGNYILKDNIELSSIDNWEPIGLCHGEFTGMFINPDGYRISNMTIRHSEREEFTWEPYKTGDAGLFGWTRDAYFDGIILDNVQIFNGDEDILPTVSGGIASNSYFGLIINCIVGGKIYAKNNAGGIVGTAEHSLIKNCRFVGEVGISAEELNQNGAGGIAGYSSADENGVSQIGVENCTVKADINGIVAGGMAGHNRNGTIVNCNAEDSDIAGENAGGMIGYNLFGDIKNCTFNGKLNGESGDKLIGYDFFA